MIFFFQDQFYLLGFPSDKVVFLDYHQYTKNSDGSTYWYIDYMKTRTDSQGRGVASKLMDQFYETVAQPGDNVHFGKMMREEIGHLKDKMKDKLSGDKDGSTLFNATDEDFEYAGLEKPSDSPRMSLQEASKQKGGSLSMEDLMELSGHQTN